MSSALNGAGAGGLLNTKQSTNANVAVYSSTELHTSPHIRGSLAELYNSLCCSSLLWGYHIQSFGYQDVSDVWRVWICTTRICILCYSSYWRSSNAIYRGWRMCGRIVSGYGEFIVPTRTSKLIDAISCGLHKELSLWAIPVNTKREELFLFSG